MVVNVLESNVTDTRGHNCPTGLGVPPELGHIAVGTIRSEPDAQKFVSIIAVPVPAGSTDAHNVSGRQYILYSQNAEARRLWEREG